MTLATILIIFLVLAVASGTLTSSAWPYARWSPLGFILLLLLVLFISGNLHR